MPCKQDTVSRTGFRTKDVGRRQQGKEEEGRGDQITKYSRG